MPVHRSKKQIVVSSSSESESEYETVSESGSGSEGGEGDEYVNTSEESSHYSSRDKKIRSKLSKLKKDVSRKYSEDSDDDDEEEEEEQEEKHCKHKKSSKKRKQNRNHSEDEEEEEEEEESEYEERKKKSKSKRNVKSRSKSKYNKSKSKSHSSKRHYEEEEESNDESDEEDDSEYSDDDEEEVINEIYMDSKDEEYMNTILSLIEKNMPATEDNLILETNSECGTEDEEVFMKEIYETNKPKDSKPKSKKTVSKKSTRKLSECCSEDTSSDKASSSLGSPKPKLTAEQKYSDLIETKKILLTELEKKPNNKFFAKSLKECQRSIHKLVKKHRTKNTKQFYQLINSENKKKNELEHFKKKLSNKEQLQLIRDVDTINNIIYDNTPARIVVLRLNIPNDFKAIAIQRINMLNSMSMEDSSYHKIKQWIDAFLKIPFGNYTKLPITIEDKPHQIQDFLVNAKKELDECVYGLDDAKLQIIQFIGQLIKNPASIGGAIGIQGAMGTGKTTLVKDGICKILKRSFSFISLGGSCDGTFLEGSSYTYEGSIWGKIVQILIQSKCMNPVIYFDELDKVSDTPKGQEIIGILTHLIDTTQNTEFHDKYFADLHFDVSKCLFIFSYNDESLLNPILKDRMYRIQTKGYNTKEKIIIGKNYLIPKIQNELLFKANEITIPEKTLEYIITSPSMTANEEGVRNLKRCLETIYRMLNLFSLTRDSNIFEALLKLKVTFPFVVEKEHVDLFIKTNKADLSQYLYFV